MKSKARLLRSLVNLFAIIVIIWPLLPTPASASAGAYSPAWGETYREAPRTSGWAWYLVQQYVCDVISLPACVISLPADEQVISLPAPGFKDPEQWPNWRR